MKICWLNDFCMRESVDDKREYAIVGGAETTIDLWAKKGRELGHDIEILTPYNFDMEKVKSADLVILSNVSTHRTTSQGLKVTRSRVTGDVPGLFSIEDIDWIIENKPFVKVEHDVKFCKFRNPQCEDYCQVFKCNPFWERKMFKKAKAVIFLSPLQLKTHLKFFWNELGSEKYVSLNNAQIEREYKRWSNVWKDMKKEKVDCIPPCVKKSEFFPSPEAVIKGTYCVLGAIYAGKGIEDILEQYHALGQNLRFIGTQNDKLLAGKIIKAGHTIVPPVAFNDLPNVLRKYQFLIVSRRIPKTDEQGRFYVEEGDHSKRIYSFLNEGFGRIIAEAKMTGLKVLIDRDSKNHMGYFSYNLPEEDMLNMCNESDTIFWQSLKSKGVLK